MGVVKGSSKGSRSLKESGTSKESGTLKQSGRALALAGLLVGLAGLAWSAAGAATARPEGGSVNPLPPGQSRVRALKGVVSAVDGDRLIVEMNEGLMPSPGDRLEIQRDSNGVAFFEVRGTWVVTAIEGGRVVATIEDPDSDPVEVGDLVTIPTTDPVPLVRPTERVTPGGPASSSTNGPEVLHGIVVGIRGRTVLLDVEGNLLPRPGDRVELLDTDVDDIPYLPIVGDWTVGAVTDGRITVTSEGAADWDELAVGNRAEIRSTRPAERADAVGDRLVGSIGAHARPIGRGEARRLSDEELPAAALALARLPRRRAVAEAAGLRDGDIVVAVDGQRVGGPFDLDRRLRRATPGTTLTLDIVRLHPERLERLAITVTVVAIGSESGRR